MNGYTFGNSWYDCKRILCIRADNMGDLLMSVPAISALKSTFHAHITVLTSSRGAAVAASIPEIDDHIVFDAPWMPMEDERDLPANFREMAEILKERQFDAAVIFTVCSQNPLPAAMLLCFAGIPLRLAYCRENPYRLLTHWIPDKEPYEFIRHQVQRDLDLVRSVGAVTEDERLHIQVKGELWQQVARKVSAAGADVHAPWILLHVEVSEEKRRYPVPHWVAAIRKIHEKMPCQFLLTGADAADRQVTDLLESLDGIAFSLAGKLSLEEFIVLIKHAPLLISVNTGAVHIAAATGTPVLVLYALTNPQHTPWKVPCKVLYFEVPERLRSRNAVVQYACREFFSRELEYATPAGIAAAALALLGQGSAQQAAEMLIGP